MLSNFIQEMRNKNSLTQEFMSKELGISRPTYIQIEQGGRDITVEEARKLAKIFGIALGDFLEADEGVQPTMNVIATKKDASSKKQPAEPEPEVRIDIPQEYVDKFQEVLLYILKKVGGKPNVGMTVLYKLLYFIDFDYYEKFEEQLMGLTYTKNHHGPTPLLFGEVIKNMIAKGEVEVIKSEFYNYPQNKYLVNPNVEPNLGILTGQEQEHIDWELQRLSDLTARQISHLSHKDVPWIAATQGMVLEYEGVFYRTSDTSVREYDDNDEYDD